MKLFTLFEMGGEYIPFDRSASTANQLGQELLRAAAAKVYQDAKDRRSISQKKVQEVAHKMADNFHSQVLKVIDEQIDVRPTRRVDHFS